MNSKFVIPAFASEAEEADWIYENRHLLEAELEKAFIEGRMRRGSPARRTSIETTTVQLDAGESKRARELAAKHNVSYETYLQQLIREGLERESNAA